MSGNRGRIIAHIDGKRVRGCHKVSIQRALVRPGILSAAASDRGHSPAVSSRIINLAVDPGLALDLMVSTKMLALSQQGDETAKGEKTWEVQEERRAGVKIVGWRGHDFRPRFYVWYVWATHPSNLTNIHSTYLSI